MHRFFRTIITPVFATSSLLAVASGDVTVPFEIRVVDVETRRGVPLVELRTVDDVLYYTDNAGRAAFREPGLMDAQVFFHVRSHGYEHSSDGFGSRGRAIEISPGGSAEIEIRRLNVAERMYRMTGYGLFRDSVLLGHQPPLAKPLLNSSVVGQDSVQASVYNGKIHWFWGDTDRIGYPLGNFRTTGATSPLPDLTDLPTSDGIDLSYFSDGDFVRPMTTLPSDGGNLMWISGVVTVTDSDGSEKLIAHYDHRAGLGDPVGHGLLVWDDAEERFAILQQIPLEEDWRHPIGQATRWEQGEQTYLLFVRPWPVVRVADDFAALQDRDAYEAFTCLDPGSRFSQGASQVERNADGEVVWGWKRETDPMNQVRERELLEAGLLEAADAHFQLRDVETGDPVQVHRSTVNWNPHLRQWVKIASQINGRSHLGEIWFAHADAPTGPWREARRIVTHDAYTFYNPAHHTFLDEDGGRFIYFEATYTNQFAGDTPATPYYDYNQIMYRLDVEMGRVAAE
ncbi:DUF4185 domain-containing protein [soil metagenome]